MAINKTDIIAFGSDHGGYNLKNRLYLMLKEKNYEVIDMGPDNASNSVDYPDYGFKVAQAITNGQAQYGVLICGSGIGISIAANRFPAVRAALCHDTTTARLAREHNNANVLVMGERLLGSITAKDCLKTFLNTDFEGGRHQNRIDKLSKEIAGE